MLCLDMMTLVERVHVACVVVRDERISSVSHYTYIASSRANMHEIKQNADLSTSVASSRSVLFLSRAVISSGMMHVK